ncbi:SDR family NAD(P)-dependent oxidoreductase [Aeromonas rivuli]|uniref:SDR family NAD(P)-dependent oxidoreductase n=1 Tax=Aeromonas rivuli TaxID=648794 RepID=UPI0005AA8155|nr:SDR family NAD(P)-dependent oxidoreductase [Aeromonas rivuli]
MSKGVLITGASSGLGRQLALDYHGDGWRVWACGRDEWRLAELAALGIQTLCFDTRDPAACQGAARQLNGLDLLILNAGSCEYLDELPRFDGALFARVIETNLVATGHCLAALLPQLGPGGRLAIVSSSVTWLPLPRAEAYGASKAALDYLAASLRLDLKASGIGVSLIRPGFIDTPLTARNRFTMPCLMTVAQAASATRRGLARGLHNIHYPNGFICLLRLLGALPTGLWLRLSKGLG